MSKNKAKKSEPEISYHKIPTQLLQNLVLLLEELPAKYTRSALNEIQICKDNKTISELSSES